MSCISLPVIFYLKFPFVAVQIHDGLGLDSSVLLFENQKIHEVSKKELPEAIYTTGSVAEVWFKKTPTSVFKLKIQKVIFLHKFNIFHVILYGINHPIPRLWIVRLTWEQRANVDGLWMRLPVTVRHSPRWLLRN